MCKNCAFCVKRMKIGTVMYLDMLSNFRFGAMPKNVYLTCHVIIYGPAGM